MWTALQVTPLPLDALAVLSPRAYESHLALLAVGAPSHPIISLAPQATVQSLYFSLVLFATYLLALSTATSSTRLRVLMATVFVAATLQAMLGALQVLGGWALPTWAPIDSARGAAVGTFANRNHLAGFIGLGASAGIALLLDARQKHEHDWRNPLRRWLDQLTGPYPLLRVAFIALVIGIVLSRSRMGNVAFVAGLAVAASLWLLSAYRVRAFFSALVLFGGIGLVDVLVVSQSFGLEAVVDRIQKTDLARERRIPVAQAALQLVPEQQLVGTGLGSFADVFQEVRPSSGMPYFDHAHNEYVEFFVEAGAMGFALLGALLLYHVLISIAGLYRRTRIYRSVAAGFLMATTAALVHASAEFNFHIPAYSVVFVALMATSVSTLRRRPTHHERTRRRRNDERNRAARPAQTATVPWDRGRSDPLNATMATRFGQLSGARSCPERRRFVNFPHQE